MLITDVISMMHVRLTDQSWFGYRAKANRQNDILWIV